MADLEDNLARAGAAPSGPLFLPLGWFAAVGGAPRYFIEVRGEVRSYRGWELASLATLLDLWPDAAHWRRCFPRSTSKIDTKAAAAHLVEICHRAGLYTPPDRLRPRPSGRPWRPKTLKS